MKKEKVQAIGFENIYMLIRLGCRSGVVSCLCISDAFIS